MCRLTYFIAIMRQLPLHILDQATGYGTRKRYSAGENIHLRGDRKPGLSVVIDGLVKVGNTGFDGAYQLTALLKKGDTFGEFTLFANLPRTHNADAFSDCEIVQLTTQQFEYWVSKEPALVAAMLANVSQKLHSALEMLDDTKRLALPVRLAKMLLALSAEQNSLHLALRQSDCAELLGVTVLSAHKALKVLAKEELLASRYGKIEISDRARLGEYVSAKASLHSLDK